MSHAIVTGFTSGAAVTIALSQLKGLLGYTKFTNSTDIVAVLSFVFSNTYLFNWRAFVIGFSFLVFLFVLRTLVRRLFQTHQEQVDVAEPLYGSRNSCK